MKAAPLLKLALAALALSAAAAESTPLWGPLSPGAATATDATQLLQALGSGVGDITLTGNVTLTPGVLARFELPIIIEPNATVLLHAPANASGRVAIDWGGNIGVLEVSTDATLAFDRIVSQHPAPYYGGARNKLPVEVKGSFLWPSVSGPEGHTVVMVNSYIFHDVAGCNPEVVQTEVKRLHQMLGRDDVGTYLGGTAAYFPYVPSPIPIEVNINHQQAGNAMYILANSTLECYDSTAASGSSSSSASSSGGGSNTVAIVVGTVVGVVVLVAAVLGAYVWHRKLRRRVKHTDAEKAGSGGEGSHDAHAPSGDAAPSKADGAVAVEQTDSAATMEAAAAAAGAAAAAAGDGTASPQAPTSHASSTGSKASTGGLTGGSRGAAGTHYSALMRSRWSGALDGVALGELLGRGAFGRVFKGRWQGAVVAVKVIEYEVHAGSTCDLSREPLLSLTLSHPNVVATHKVCVLRLSSGSHQPHSGPQDTDRLSDGARPSGAPTAKGSGSAPLSRSRSASLDTEGAISVELVPLNEPLQPGLYESWLVQDYCDAGSLADIVSSSSSSTSSQQHSSSTASGGGKDRLARLRASICCSADPEQRMLGNLLCLLDVASGLDYLHSCCNMVHGDLKPANCLLRSVPAYTDRRGVTVKLADFGLSRLLNPDETSIHTGSTGTPGFAAPELLTEGKLTKAADIYSLGLIMWGLVARASPHAGSNPLSIIYLVAHQRFRPPIPEGCPPALAALMQRCWAHEPAERPTAAEVVEELRAILRARFRDAAAAAALPPGGG